MGRDDVVDGVLINCRWCGAVEIQPSSCAFNRLHTDMVLSS
jgi:hypothetical protein